MTPGDKWELTIPSKLAYKDSQRGRFITPGSVLIFQLEILSCSFAKVHKAHSKERQGKIQLLPLCPRTTPFPEGKYILGVIYGVLLWADMNTAIPLGAWGRSVMSLERRSQARDKAAVAKERLEHKRKTKHAHATPTVRSLGVQRACLCVVWIKYIDVVRLSTRMAQHPLLWPVNRTLA